MTLLDVAIILPIAYFAYRGFENGLVKEVFSIAGIILAVFFTFEYMHVMSDLLTPLFESGSDMLPLVAGISLFVSILVLVHVAAYLIRKFLEALKINFVNRIFGTVFGGLKSGIVISAVLLLLAGINLPGEDIRDRSVSYSYILYLAPTAFNMVSAVYPGAEDFVTTIQNTLEEHNPILDNPIFDQ